MNLPGYGDEQTWGRYLGHPNDPRTEDCCEDGCPECCPEDFESEDDDE